MNKKDLHEAIGGIDEKYIAEAAAYKRKTKIAMWIASAAAAAACIGGAFFAITALNSPPVIADKVSWPKTVKVGKYYLNGIEGDQYIEVYDDKTICLFGVDTSDMEEIKNTGMDLFINRKYYVIHDKLPFVGLFDDPDTGYEDMPAVVGYGLESEECITFATAEGDILYYYYAEADE